MKESIRQLMGLERRKRGLDMLADAIEAGMKRNDDNAGVGSESKVEVKSNEEIDESGALNKRKREESDESEHVVKKERN